MARHLKEVLNAYNINPIIMNKVTPKLYHVRDGKQEYALKISDLNHEVIRQWEDIYRYSIKHNLHSVLPVYLTKSEKLHFQDEQSIYYVSPWLEVRQEEREREWITNFYTTLANLHSDTKRIHKIEIENISEQFQSFQSYCWKMREYLLALVGQFEQSRYMSPIELLVCTQFRDIEQAFIEIDKRIQSFINDQEDGQITWSSSLCHRNLNKSHVLASYFINWESARYDHPVMDLFLFFNQEIGRFNPQAEQYLELFPTYMKTNELTLPELQYFSIYLLSPINYIQTIQNYVQGLRKESMIETITKLQHEYRKVIFGLNWSKYIEKEHETLDLDDLEL